MAYQRGVFVSEQGTSLTVPLQSTAGLQVVFGTAPIHLAKNPYACTNVPVLVNSFPEAAEKLGYSDDFGSYTLCQSVDACFRKYAVAPVVLVNVLDPETHKKNLEETTIPIKDGTASVQADGVLLDKLVVKADAQPLVAGTDYTVAFDMEGHPAIKVLTGGAAASASELKVSGVCIDPSAVKESDIVGGYNASTAKETGLEVLRQVFPRLGLTPGLLLAPGWSHKASVATALQAKCTGVNGLFSCECIVDIDTSVARNYDQVKAAKDASGVTSPHAIAVWPKVVSGGKVYYYSALYGAVTAVNDADHDGVPAISPSNKALPASSLIGEDGVEIVLDLAQANQVCGYGVITALNLSNGFVTWGNNTAAYPGTTDPKDRWFCTRRFFSWWGNTFILTYFQKVDDPANFRQIQSICDSENVRGNSFVARGFCAGARIEYREDENPVTQVLDGKIAFHQYLAPYTPMECITNTLEFDPTALQAALGG
ncbi:phage tail sheath family protein [Intestinibacillus massiliensis]